MNVEQREKLRELAAAATPCAGLPGYGVTPDGTVWSLTSNWRGYGPRPLVPTFDTSGYHRVRVLVDGRRVNRSVHRLVAEAFHGSPLPDQQACHVNGVRTDNRAINLRWGTAQENAQDRDRHGTTARGSRSGTARLTEEQVRQLRSEAAGGSTTRELAGRFGICTATVLHIVRREYWRHVA